MHWTEDGGLLVHLSEDMWVGVAVAGMAILYLLMAGLTNAILDHKLFKDNDPIGNVVLGLF